MSATIIPLEEGWSTLDAGLRRAEATIFGYVVDRGMRVDDGKIGRLIPTEDHKEMYTTVYTMCTQKRPHNWSGDVYQRLHADAQQFSARAIARLAGEQGDQYAVTLFNVCHAYEMYTSFAQHVFKYLNRYYVKRMSLPEIQDVLSQAFGDALGLEATALSNGDGDRAHDIAWLRYMQERTRMRNGPTESNSCA